MSNGNVMPRNTAGLHKISSPLEPGIVALHATFVSERCRALLVGDPDVAFLIDLDCVEL